MAEKLFRKDRERAGTDVIDREPSHAPGKSTLTSRLPMPVIYRAAREGAANEGSRDERGVAPGADEHVARASGGSGSALPDTLRSRFEDSLGTDLSGVRVHTGSESAAAADAVGAKAYAVGQDIHFGSGHYDPASSEGQFLIAHEVAHTVQQAGSTPSRQYKLEVSSSGDAAECEADRAASAMVAGQPFALSSSGSTLARKQADAPAPPGDASGWGKAAKVADAAKKFKDGTVPFSLLGKEGALSYGEDGITGSLELGSAALGLGTPLSHSLYAQLGPAGGVFLKVGASAKASADASVAVSGSAPSGDPLVVKGMFTGSGSVGLSASGRVTVGGYVGAQIANFNAGGYLELSAKASMPVQVGGSVQITESGENTGSLTFKVAPKASLVATGGITIGYNAVITEGTLYEHEVGSLTIAEVSLPCEVTYDMKTRKTSQKGGEVEVKWLEPKLPGPKISAFEKVGSMHQAALQEGVAKGTAAREKEEQEERERREQARVQGEIDRKKQLADHGVHEDEGYSEEPWMEPQECVPEENLEPETASTRKPRKRVRSWLDTQ